MIGIVIATHGGLGQALLDTAEFILGRKPEAANFVSINIDEDPEQLRNRIARGIKEVNRRDGVLVMTDMFGGTPSNICYSFLEDGKVEVISGVNLPMLLRTIGSRENRDLASLALEMEVFGRKSISLASGLLKGKKRG